MSDSGVVPVSGFLWPLYLGGLIMDVCSYLMGWWGFARASRLCLFGRWAGSYWGCGVSCLMVRT